MGRTKRQRRLEYGGNMPATVDRKDSAPVASTWIALGNLRTHTELDDETAVEAGLLVLETAVEACLL